MAHIRETARFHIISFALVHRDHCISERYHTLFLLDHQGIPVPYEPFLDYVYNTGRTKSLAWQKEAAFSLGLFIDFIVARDQAIKNGSIINSSSGSINSTSLFSLFAKALTSGSISSIGVDPLNLYWEPKSTSRAGKIIQQVTLFSDWLANRMGTALVNPWRQATYAERIASLRHIDARKPHELLGYVSTQAQHNEWASKVRSIQTDLKLQKSLPKEPKIFPDARVMELISKGFILPASTHNDPLHMRVALHNAMIVTLMHGGGLRESEPFHLYVSDVGIDKSNPNSAEVRLYHPEQGWAPVDHVDPITGQRIITDRTTYLSQKYGLIPRNKQVGRFSAGFKDLFLLDPKEKYALVHWFPSYWGEIFLSLFKSYIFHCRKRVSSHPYLLVSAKTGYAGDPYTVDSFRQAHANACIRIGLNPSKEDGTTPHGHRHAYGQALSKAKVDEIFIQRAMHHRSIHSQRVYTAPTQVQMMEALSTAEARLALSEPHSLLYPIESLKLLSPLNNFLSFK